MGFNKRFVDKETIIAYFENKTPLSTLFSADAIIFMDKISSKIYNLHKEGVKDKEIKKLFNLEKKIKK